MEAAAAAAAATGVAPAAATAVLSDSHPPGALLSRSVPEESCRLLTLAVFSRGDPRTGYV